jgi:hypothetical protein
VKICLPNAFEVLAFVVPAILKLLHRSGCWVSIIYLVGKFGC